MRIALVILIGIHGIIHLFGFLEAFGLTDFNAISQPISKPYGLSWGVAFILFVFTFFFICVNSKYWWFFGFLAVLLSQVLIFNYWSDAKFGTIVNLIILVSALIAYSGYNFDNKIAEERKKMFNKSHMISDNVVDEASISGLPLAVQKWIINSGTLSKSPISSVYLTQDIKLKMKPEQSDWNDGVAEQYFTTQPPAFNWSITTQMNSILKVTGRDKFENGNGEIIIKLLSLIPVAYAKPSEKVNQATLQRYLAEIVWFPSMATSPLITWESIDDYSARATMSYKETEGSGVFHFDKKGQFKKFAAMRYQDVQSNLPTEWIVVAKRTEDRNGIKIPVECEASWELDNGKWTWLKLKIIDIQYNLKQMPVDRN